MMRLAYNAESSWHRARPCRGGQLVIGKQIDCSDLLQAELGSEAGEYLVKVVK